VFFFLSNATDSNLDSSLYIILYSYENLLYKTDSEIQNIDQFTRTGLITY